MDRTHGTNAEMNAELIVLANESALARINTVAAQYIRYHQLIDSHGSRDIPGRTLHAWWWKDGEKHRLRYYVEADSNQKKTTSGAADSKANFVDVLMGEQRTLFLSGYDWEQRPEIPFGKHKELEISASISPRGLAFPQVDPMCDTCLHVENQPESHSLKQLYDKRKPMKLERIEEHGKEYPQLTFKSPEDGRIVNILVDPDASCLVKRIVRQPSAAELKVGASPYCWNVERFKSTSDGVLFPEKVTVTTPSGVAGETYRVTLEFTQLSINERLPESVFDFRFPKNAAVVDAIEGAVHIWGDNGPERTIHNIEEDEDLARELLSNPEKLGVHRSFGLFIWANIIIVVLLAFSVVYYRVQASRRGL